MFSSSARPPPSSPGCGPAVAQGGGQRGFQGEGAGGGWGEARLLEAPLTSLRTRVLPGDFCESLRFWLCGGPDDDKAKTREWGNRSPVSSRSAGVGPGFGVLEDGLGAEAQAPCGQGESPWLLPAHGAPGQPERWGGRGALPTQVGPRSRERRGTEAGEHISRRPGAVATRTICPS